MAINTDISAMVDRQTGSQFGGNLIQALGMMQRGKQAEKDMAFRDKQQAFENDLKLQQFEANQRDAERTYNLLRTNLANEQADKDALALITERANGNLDMLDEELAKFSPKSIFGIRAHSGLQGQLKTHLMEKKAATTRNYFEDSARKNLDPEDYLTWINMENNPDTGLPGAEKVSFLNARIQSKDAGTLDFEDVEIGGKPYTTVRARGSKNFRLIPHDVQGGSKLHQMKWQEASRIYRDATSALSDLKKTLRPEQAAEARAAQAAAKKTMEEMEVLMSSPQSPAGAAPTTTTQDDPLGLFK